MIRRYGAAGHIETRYKHRPGAYAIITDGRDILLTYQDAPHFEFQLPGGGIDPGECALPALHREVLEETGWTMRPERKLGVFRRFVYMPEYDICAEKLCHIYLCRTGMRQGDPREEGHSAVWMTPDVAATRLANPGDRAFVRRLFRL